MKKSSSNKRVLEDNNNNRSRKDGNNIDDNDGGDNEELIFEDPFGDEFEEEEIYDDNDNEEDEDEDEVGIDSEDMMRIQNQDEEVAVTPKEVWRPGIDKINEGEELDFDPSAYIMYHSFRTEWPCLSFDILKDNLGDNRQRFPMSMYIVTGSQADKGDKNKLTLLKLSDLRKTQVKDEDDDDEDDDDDNDDDDDDDEDPTLEHVNVAHPGGVNRIRSMQQAPGIVASMAETGQVHIYDLQSTLKSMMATGPRAAAPTKPAFTFRGHRSEGFAIDWSPKAPGKLATGDCMGNIHVWNCEVSAQINTNQWQVDPKPYIGHKGSVEDIQWSPSEATVFSSASTDKTVKIWDTRGKNPQLSIDAHNEDVNVISWNRSVGYLLASGCDDGSFKVWDLRTLRSNSSPIANFQYHKGAITSIEWAPHDESVISVSGSDNQLTVWDLSVEADTNNSTDPVIDDFPPQLLFIHQGQYNIKELHHHPQINGVVVSTAEDGFNIFKPAISVK